MSNRSELHSGDGARNTDSGGTSNELRESPFGRNRSGTGYKTVTEWALSQKRRTRWDILSFRQGG